MKKNIIKQFKKAKQKNNLVIIISLALAASVLLLLVLYDIGSWGGSLSINPDNQKTGPQVDPSMPEKELNRFEYELDESGKLREGQELIIPNVDTELTEAEKLEVAIPDAQTPTSLEAETSYRGLLIEIENNEFKPFKVIVKERDIINLSFLAKDKDYDVFIDYYGVEKKLAQGEWTALDFQAYREGIYDFYCLSCGGPSKGPKGQLIVVP